MASKLCPFISITSQTLQSDRSPPPFASELSWRSLISIEWYLLQIQWAVGSIQWKQEASKYEIWFYFILLFIFSYKLFLCRTKVLRIVDVQYFYLFNLSQLQWYAHSQWFPLDELSHSLLIFSLLSLSLLSPFHYSLNLSLFYFFTLSLSPSLLSIIFSLFSSFSLFYFSAHTHTLSLLSLRSFSPLSLALSLSPDRQLNHHLDHLSKRTSVSTSFVNKINCRSFTFSFHLNRNELVCIFNYYTQWSSLNRININVIKITEW